MTCPFCEPKAFDYWTIKHIETKPLGEKKILLTLEKAELEHLENQVNDNYIFPNIQYYLRVLIRKDRNRVHQLKISEPAEPDI